MIYPEKIRINGGRLTSDTLVDKKEIKLSWAIGGEGEQKEYCIGVFYKDKPLFESGWVKSDEQSCRLSAPLISGFRYRVSIKLRDEKGVEGSFDQGYFRVALLENWDAPWIMPAEDFGDSVIYFKRDFELGEKSIENAVLYLCGIGYHGAKINGKALSDHKLAPSISNYNKRCYYETLDALPFLSSGKNSIEIEVAQGWRRNCGDYLKHVKDKEVSFFGRPQLTAILSLVFNDGSTLKIVSDEAWLCGKGKIAFSHVFDGEVYDARTIGTYSASCVIADKPHKDSVMCPDLLEPIRVKRVFKPLSVYKALDGYIFDLGQNIAGVVEISVPKGLAEGTVIRLLHAEMLDENGDIYTAPLRGAKAEDVYIVGKENPEFWSPSYTYHGFRYVKVCGLPMRPSKDFLCGLQFYTDIDSQSYFRCGSAIVNKLQEMIVMTERDNIHSIATDCPQRDERMGWLNDASVRFEEMPYNFDVGRLFPKIIGDIRDEQIDGAITCTVPYVFGNRPADPVCSSFLISAYMSYMHYNNKEIIEEAYPAMCAWNDYLERISEDGIIPISYYGDWASPKDCCIGSARSALTPGEFMSTGYHYLNSKLLAIFADILGNVEDGKKHRARAEFVCNAIRSKWLSRDGKMATGSQACQAFSLRFGLIPENLREKAAEIMKQEVENAGNRLTTGNLCTLYLMESLTDAGYIDTAWDLITREEYPSWGYMIQNGATSVWERFELKKDPGMNSHCHPMYGAVGKWLYSHIAGITPVDAGFKKMIIRPYFPKKLLSAEAVVDTCMGDVTVKWNKSYDKTHLICDIPFGTEAKVMFGGKEYSLKGGTQSFVFDGTL